MLDRFCLGTAQFGFDYGISNSRKVSPLESSLIVDEAYKAGINFIDTAQTYGDSEKFMGNFSNLNLNIITKIDFKNFIHEDDVNLCIENSFQNLNINRIHSILFHDSKFFLNNICDAAYKRLMHLKSEGKIQNIGVSLYHLNDIDFILKNYDIDIIQIPYNIFDASEEKRLKISELKNKNIHIHARSIFLQGLLLMDFKKLPQFFDEFKSSFDALNSFLVKDKINIYDLCVVHALLNQSLDKIIIGFNSHAQFIYFIKRLKHLTFDSKYKNLFFDVPEKLKYPYYWSQ